uniref:Uncharacterized protein n=1 Tax=Ananas comosus var. bracteatus TaxID=296719 RepID=A0A6V7PQ61_ANACO|nr:unnamed protein product [Ananas comosus var. bracteatus]
MCGESRLSQREKEKEKKRKKKKKERSLLGGFGASSLLLISTLVAWSSWLKLRGGSNFNPTWLRAWVGASLEVALDRIWRPFELCLRISSPRSFACLPLCSFALACEGRSLQAGTPEIAIAIYARSCGIGRRNGMPWGRLIPRVGMLTTTGPLGTAQARQPTEPSAPAKARDRGKRVA